MYHPTRRVKESISHVDFIREKRHEERKILLAFRKQTLENFKNLIEQKSDFQSFSQQDKQDYFAFLECLFDETKDVLMIRGIPVKIRKNFKKEGNPLKNMSIPLDFYPFFCELKISRFIRSKILTAEERNQLYVFLTPLVNIWLVRRIRLVGFFEVKIENLDDTFLFFRSVIQNK